MTYSWHPWLGELASSNTNRVRAAWRRPLRSGAYLVVAAALLGLLWLGLRQLDGDRAGVIIHLLIAQPLVLVALFAAVGFFGVHGATLSLASEWRYGWWGALPIPDAAARRTLRLAMTVFTALLMLFVLGLLGLIAVLSRHADTWFFAASTLSIAGLAIGGFVGYLTSRGTQAPERQKVRAISAARPLFALRWADAPGLPYLGSWLRRDALRRWRHGGHKWPFLMLGLATPAGMALGTLLGLLILALSLIWFGTVLRTGADVIAEGDSLLAATPLGVRKFAAATARYPLWAWGVASLWGLLALLLQEARLRFAIGYAPALAFVALLYLALAWRYRARPVLARVRFTAESLFGLALFLLAGPWALLVPLFLLLRHLQVVFYKR